MVLALIYRLAEPIVPSVKQSDLRGKKNSDLCAGNLWILEVVQPED